MSQTIDLSDDDLKLLRLIQSDAGMSKQELANAAGLSISTLWRRMNELEAIGAIAGRATLLDPIKVGASVCAILSINLVDHGNGVREEFEAFVNSSPEIMECFLVTGAFDYLLIVRSKSVQDLELFLMNKILGHKAVATTSSQIALSQKKYSTQLPI